MKKVNDKAPELPQENYFYAKYLVDRAHATANKLVQFDYVSFAQANEVATTENEDEFWFIRASNEDMAIKHLEEALLKHFGPNNPTLRPYENLLLHRMMPMHNFVEQMSKPSLPPATHVSIVRLVERRYFPMYCAKDNFYHFCMCMSEFTPVSEYVSFAIAYATTGL